MQVIECRQPFPVLYYYITPPYNCPNTINIFVHVTQWIQVKEYVGDYGKEEDMKAIWWRSLSSDMMSITRRGYINKEMGDANEESFLGLEMSLINNKKSQELLLKRLLYKNYLICIKRTKKWMICKVNSY